MLKYELYAFTIIRSNPQHVKIYDLQIFLYRIMVK